MSHYNKAESIHAYINHYRLSPKQIIFIDDFCQNAYNVGWYFSCRTYERNKANVPAIPSLQRVDSVWWDPSVERDIQQNMVLEQQTAIAENGTDTETVQAARVQGEDSFDPKYDSVRQQIEKETFEDKFFYPYIEM